MTSSSFPDINVWLAAVTPEHLHHAAARQWIEQQAGTIYFIRFTQIGFLRLVTTAAAMDGKPLDMAQAWRAYDWFFQSERVAFLPDPAGAESKFRSATKAPTISPKLWADAWLLAVADAAGGVVVTFDRALGARGAHCLLGTR